FFAVAVLLLTYLGAGISALTLPSLVQPMGWLVAPFIGYSLLVTLSALLVAFGANVEVSLVSTGVISTIANVLSWRYGHLRSLGSLRWWLVVPLLAVPSFAVSAATMAHNGSMAYVGGQADLTIVLPLIEWLKTHSAPIFVAGSPPFVSPGWLDSVAPLGGWLGSGVQLGSVGHSPEEIQAAFQRGPVYLMSSLAAILGWDAAIVYRPSLAFMLSLSLPAMFVFCRKLVGASIIASLLAVALAGLNGTLFFWVAFGHPSQAIAAGLVPIALVLVVFAIEASSWLPTVGAALSLAALLISYYWAVAPIMIALLVPPLVYLFNSAGRPRRVVVRTTMMVVGAVIIALPEHLKMLMLLAQGALRQLPVANDSNLASIGDALGTTLHQSAFALVAGQGQVGDLGLTIFHSVSLVATVVATLLTVVGVARGRAARLGLFRAVFAGPLLLLAALAVSGYLYGYDKAQASVTFIFAAALALGLEQAWKWAFTSAHRSGRLFAFGRTPRLLALGTTAILVSGTLVANFALSDYAFWKPVGNIWDPRAWEASALTEALPANAEVEISPDILTAPEPLFATLYFLRNQVLEGVFSLGGTFGKRVLILPQASTAGSGGSAGPTFDVLGTSEIAAAKGLIPSDLVWAGSIVNAYRHGDAGLGGVAVRSAAGAEVGLPAHLPATVEVQPGAQASGGGTAGQTGYLLFVLAADGPATVGVTAGPEERSFQIGPGVSVRSIRLRSNDRVVFDETGGARVQLLTATARMDGSHPPPPEDYPEALAAVGQSKLEGNVISTRFSYLDIGVLAFHSVDIYNADSNSHQAWFDLPTYPDKQLRDVQFDFNAATLDHQTFLDGADAPRRSTAEPSKDGDYVACFSIWTVRSLVKSIPIYRYRLEGGKVTNFEPFDLTGVWDGRTVAVGG
ncbi:MAG: hypothetical protein M1582_05220, partial [Actinobacteria bacterium]|nr:hypothetical protein [Actinomycetota bacterium]